MPKIFTFILAKSLAVRLRKLSPRILLKAKMKIEEGLLEAEEAESTLQDASV